MNFRSILFAPLFSICVALVSPKTQAVDLPQPVQTLHGAIRGHMNAGVVRYLGIPYAKPPVGALRWHAPRDPAPWQGALEANRWSEPCAQTGTFYGSDDPQSFDRPYGSEDCLYLNVWAPQQASSLPVLVFVHGGGGVVGAASLGAYEASRLSLELNAVVVSINYRLGFFGGINTPALQTGDPVDDAGVFWLLDQIKALEWVQGNVNAFGGDPANVTVMGHSAGAVSIWAMQRSPLAAGKFKRAVVLSGFPVSSSQDELSTRTAQLIDRLRQLDGQAQTPVSAVGDAAPNAPLDLVPESLSQQAAQGQEAGTVAQPTAATPAAKPSQDAPLQGAALRDYLYARSTEQLIKAGYGIRALAGGEDGTVLNTRNENPTRDFSNAVPTLFGIVANEMSFLVFPVVAKTKPAEFWELMNSGRADLRRSDFMSWWGWCKYKVMVPLLNVYARREVATAADRLAQTGVPVYGYRFEWNHQPEPWRHLFGSYHGLDVPFLFGNFQTEVPNFGRFSWSEDNALEREAIHQQMVAGLRGFIESGDPNRYATDVHWPLWTDSRRPAVIR